MNVQINTDGNINGHEKLLARVRSDVEIAMIRFRDHVSRVEVHLRDQVGDNKGEGDKSCMMEARIVGRPPVAVTLHGENLDQAINSALEKLVYLISSTLEKKRTRKHHRTQPPHAEP